MGYPVAVKHNCQQLKSHF